MLMLELAVYVQLEIHLPLLNVLNVSAIAILVQIQPHHVQHVLQTTLLMEVEPVHCAQLEQ